MENKMNIHGVMVDKVSMQQAIDRIVSYTKESGVHTVFTPNSEIIMQAQRDDGLKKILNESDMLIADGAGVILAARLLNIGLNEKVSGVDLISRLFPIAKRNSLKFYFLGGAPNVAQLAAVNVMCQCPGIEISGYRDGYFNEDETDKVIEAINASKANILLVGLGAPKQEKWIVKYKDRVNVKVCIGVGGSFDILSGKAKLAPEFMRKSGFEWLYRLIKEPRRFKRMMDLPKFILLTLKVRMFGSKRF